MQVWCSLDVDGEPIGAGLSEGGHVAGRVADHQVHIERQVRDAAQCPHDGRTDGDVRHEVTVHHVHVDIVRAGGLDACDRLGQVGEVGGEYGGGDFDGLDHQGDIIQ